FLAMCPTLRHSRISTHPECALAVQFCRLFRESYPRQIRIASFGYEIANSTSHRAPCEGDRSRGEAGSVHNPTGYTAFGLCTWRHTTLRHTVSVGQMIDSCCPHTNEVRA